ncbi:MAG: DegV family protein [Ruminococcaceae bacterium]|nr:DegV family protein [Oscillospiraceae bacterium]
MADFRVVTDSSCDLSDEIIKEREIVVIPFNVMQVEGIYKKHRTELGDEEFYNWMVDNPKLFPKSAAPAIEDFAEAFTEAAKAGEKVICMCITTKFSCSYQSATIAMEMVLENYPDAKIHVCDTMSNTVLQGLLVNELCNLRDAGVSFDEAIRSISSIKTSGRILFTIGGIEYLGKGGRIGKLAGKVGAVLGIRPLITLRDGEIHPSGVCRGRAKSLEKVLNLIKSYCLEAFKSGDDFVITVGYGYDYDEAVLFRDRVSALLEELGMKNEVPIRRIGAVIGVHTGPYPLGIGIVRKAKIA